MQPSNLQNNLQKLADIKAENKAYTHVNIRTDDDRLIDVPIEKAEWTVRQYPTFRIIEGAVADLPVLSSHEELPVIPPKPSEEPVAPLPVLQDPVADRARFDELKAQWPNLVGEERKEYMRLKKTLGL